MQAPTPLGHIQPGGETVPTGPGTRARPAACPTGSRDQRHAQAYDTSGRKGGNGKTLMAPVGHRVWGFAGRAGPGLGTLRWTRPWPRTRRSHVQQARYRRLGRRTLAVQSTPILLQSYGCTPTPMSSLHNTFSHPKSTLFQFPLSHSFTIPSPSLSHVYVKVVHRL